MKKRLAILLILLLFVSTLAGCGSNSTSNNQTDYTEPTREVAQTDKHTAAESFAGGNGTEDDPFQISDASHLVLLHEMLKKEENDDTYLKGYYVLTADIALNDTSDFENWRTNAPKYGWEPIGAGEQSNSFSGVLDGNGHKITGMFIDADGNQSKSPYDYYGLFARLRGTVKNLTVEQSYIRASGNTAQVGTIAGDIYKAEIVNCNADSVIELYSAVDAGGISGQGGYITDCSYTGTITQLDEGFSHIGGIVGSEGNISGCEFSGTLAGKGYTGGIVGYGKNVKNCINKGSVSGDIAGGISGNVYAAGTNMKIENPHCSIENCINEGKVAATTLAGGIVGKMGNDESDISMSVINCENKGQVGADISCAGIIGSLSVERAGMMKVENCVNYADIVCKEKASGIVGEILGSVLHQEGDVVISGCKNLGDVTAEEQYSSGVISYFLVMGNEVDLSLTVDHCSNEGAIQSTNCAGGILGFSNVGFNAEVSAESLTFSDDTKVSFSNCTNNGNITVKGTNSMVGGIVGVMGLGYIPMEIMECTNSGTVCVDFKLTEEQISENQGLDWPEFYQIAGGIVGRIGDGVILTTAEGVETSADNVNAANARIKISGCNNTGSVNAPNYSYILNKWEKPLYVNYLGGIIGQCSATNGYAFSVENCTYSGAERGLGDTNYADVGTKH